jgi:hypothetical protein
MLPEIPTPRNRAERLQLANQFFREYHTRCFWHSPREAVITEETIPFVVKGLRTYGGRRGFLLASKLQSKWTPLRDEMGEPEGCH